MAKPGNKRTPNAVPKVCLVGRPNVGKSSLFNRLVGRKKALVLDEPGVTRDVHRVEVTWAGHRLEMADLAGLELYGRKRADERDKKTAEAETLKRLATQAALDYLATADLVLFVVDGREALTPADEELARVVRGAGCDVQLVLAKIEGRVGEQAELEASGLGWGDPLRTSAEHNSGIEDLMTRILEILFQGRPGTHFEEPEDSAEESRVVMEEGRGISTKRPIRLGVYGRPNVGKSTLVNRLLGESRMITSPVAGTTVDTVDTDFVRDGRHYRILDTAGIRRRSKTEKGVEVLSVVQALKSLEHVDVSLFMLDGYEGVTDQDEKVAGELIKGGKPIAIIVNKWDLCQVERDEYAERLRDELGFLDYAPVLFVCAKSGEGLDGVFDLIGEILAQRFVNAPTGELNRFIELIEGSNSASGLRLYYASQTGKNPPTITFQVNDTKKVHYSFERQLKNELRNRYGWMGSPLKLIFKARKRSPSKRAREARRQ